MDRGESCLIMKYISVVIEKVRGCYVYYPLLIVVGGTVDDGNAIKVLRKQILIKTFDPDYPPLYLIMLCTHTSILDCCAIHALLLLIC